MTRGIRAFLGGVVLLGSFISVSAQAVLPRDQSMVQSIVQHIEEVPTPDSVYAEFACKHLPQGNPIRGSEINIEEIINIGQKIWKIIEGNKPAITVKSAYANALPRGVKSSEELDGFTDLQFRTFRIFGKNAFGANVYDVTYTLVHRYNGSYEGRGKFLEGVTVMPSSIEVTWGYTMDVAVAQVSAANVGTRQDPIASLGMELTTKVSTAVKVIQTKELFEFRGDTAKVRSNLR